MSARTPGQQPLPLNRDARLGFEDFVVSEANHETLHHLRQLASGQGERFVFLWGEHGSGKTHLLRATAAAARKLERNAHDLDWAEWSANPTAQIEALAAADLVCLDAVPKGRRDAAADLALFDLYNRLADRGNGLLLSSERPPRELNVQLHDLRSRLQNGLTLRLHPLNDELKLCALQRRAARYGFELSPEVGQYLLTHLRRDMVFLCALLARLDEATLSAQRRLTIPFLKHYLEEAR